MIIEPIAAFSDNYIWCLSDNGQAVIVDPGDAAPVRHYLESHQLHLVAILVTHHHPDHTGGVAELAQEYPGIPVIGPKGSPYDRLSQTVEDGDTVSVLHRQFSVISIPGHTLDHIAFWHEHNDQSWLFCGDTLFAGGCGRIFEGTPAQMYNSLQRINALPGHTLVYCAHEYTLANLRFARAVEPDNDVLAQRLSADEERREQGLPTVPTTLAVEQATNPFLRCDTASINAAATLREGGRSLDPLSTFTVIREWKNNF